MAGIRKIYTSQNEYLEDVVSTSDLFDKEYYETAKEAGKGLEYLTIMAGTKDNISSSFNQTIYDELSGEDRFNYYITENVLDKSSEQYASNKQYFDNKIQQIKNQQTYDGLNGFEKTMATIGGYVGNAFVQLGGIVEGLVDASATLIGAMGSDDFKERTKEFIAKDTTGYNAAQQAMNDWINKYTFIDKNVVTKAINDVTTGIVRMTPMIIGGMLAPATGGISAKIGTSVYYASMAGNTAEQTIQANPDIDYGSLLLYTGASTGLEALTEWASGKLFGDDIVSSLMKGQKYAPTGSIVKNIAKNFGTEALEEATAEIFGSMLYKTIVDPTAETATFGDIFYAAIIGGLTGAVMSGGQILTTKRMSVKDGKLIATSELSKADKKSAKQLGIAKSWGLNNLLSQVQQGQQSTNEVTKLMAKYGTSVNNIMVSHQDEYNQALAKDTETKTQQAKAILDLANLMRAIGVEQFQRSAEFLNNSLEEARTLVNNYFTHTATYNANASAEFSEAFPDESFTPVAQPTNAEIELAKVLRHTFPQLKIAFGQFGSKNGTAVKSINDTKGWLFIKSGLVETMGYNGVLNQIVKKELSKGVLSDLSKMKPELVDSLVGLIDTDKKHYSDLSEREKTVVAQIICFDPVNNRRLFERNNKLHSRIFSYLTKQSEYVKRFGRKTSANKMLYHDLLSIREMFLNNIAQTIFNNEDVAQIQIDYDLTSEEVAEKITNKTRETSLNKLVRLTNINFSKESVLKREAIYELIEARLDTTVDFDYTRIYDESYYNPEWVQQIKTQQQTQDFKEALNAHFEATVQNTLEDRASFVELMEGVLTQSDIDRLSKTLITEQRRAETADMPLVMMYDVIDVLYTMTANDVDNDVDSIVIKDDQIKGTGKLKFLKVKIDERNNIYNDQQTRGLSESAREQVGNVVTKSTTIADKVTINQIDESSYNDRLREIVRHAKREYGANVHFYSGSANFQQANIDINDGLNGFVVGIDDIYLRYDETTPFRDIEDVLLHEGTHILIAKDPSTFKDVRNKLRDKVNERVSERNKEDWMDWAIEGVGPEPVGEQLPWDKLMAEYSSPEMYGDIYDKKSDIEEELVVDLLTFRTVTKERSTNGDIRNIAYEYYATTKDDTGARRKYATKTRDLSDVSFEEHDVWDRAPYQQLNAKYAVWKQSTLDKLIERFGRWDNDSYTSAYVAYINPVNFVANSTQGALERKVIRQKLFEPDEKKRKTDVDDYDYMTKIDETVKEDNVPRFWIDTDTMEITSHEGRHRNYTFDINNIENVPVLLIVDKGIAGNNPLANRMYKNVTFKGQQQSITEVDSPDAVMFGVMVPLNESHRTELEKLFVKGDVGEPKIRFAKDLKQQNKQETSIQQKINKAESPKQIADVITAIIEAAPLEVSETKGYGDEGTRMYKKTSDEMRRKYASLWTKLTQENYDNVRNELVKSDYEYADEALLIFDRFTRAYAGNSTKFDEATKKKIMEVGSRKQTIAAISQGLQSAELANDHSFGETAAAFEKDGYKVTVSNDIVKEYVPEMANKKEFIKELDKEISNIEEQITTAETDIDAAELNNQLDKVVEKRIVMSEGTNEEIMDWVIANEDIVTKATKLQKEVFEQMVNKGELAQKEGKKAVTILVDEKTGLPKPFPKATQFIEKNVKRLKSFRMWAMLTSPVSWVRNWVGNAGMTALDGMTNSLEKFITSKQKVMSQQELTKLEKHHQDLSRKEKLTDTEKSKLAQLSNQIARNYDFKFVETKASKDLRKQIADDYKDVIQQILNGEDVKYESSAEKAAAITRAERKITRASQNANLGQKLWAACQSMTDWGLNTGWFGDNAVVVNSLVKNFANMVESNKTYLIKSLTTEYGKNGRGMSAERKELVEKALKTKDSMDIVNAMSKYDVTLFMDSCKQRTFEQYFKNSNWLSQWASNLSKKHPIAASLTSLVLPFPKVAANILSMAYKYSPLGFLSAARQWSVVKQMDAAGYEGVRDAFARAKAGRTTAQATVGSFMMLAGLILASLGFIDIDDDDYLGPSLKVGDWKVSLSNLAPSMTTFSVGSAMMWAWKNDHSATLKALDVLYDNTLLGNIENVFRYGDPSKYIENLSINYFSQYVPAVLKLFAKFTTNQEMIDKSGSYFAKLGKTFASGIPFVANALPKKINPYTGEVLTGTGSQNVFFNFIEALSPLDFKTTKKSATQKEAERLGTESSGLSGAFKVNDIEYDVDKVTYGKYRANYIEENFEKILSGKQKVTVEDENGKRITTTYDKLTDKQKKNVINRLYTEATSMTKIKWWTDLGNKYVVTDQNLYNEYRKMFKNIVYKNTWSKSKFMES